MAKLKKPKKIEILRHSLAHVLAAAVLEMFPEAKFGVGPAVENGFYYDFDLPRTLIPEDLEILENKMKKIIEANYKFEKADIYIKEAIKSPARLAPSREASRQNLEKFLSIARENSLISAPGLTLTQLGKLTPKLLSSLKFPELIGKGIKKTKCFSEFTA